MTISYFRYGLPVNFQGMLLRPARKNSKRLRDTLNTLYGHLDSTALAGQKVGVWSIGHLFCNTCSSSIKSSDFDF